MKPRRWTAVAREVAERAGDPGLAVRLLVAACLHNRSFVLLGALAREVRPALTVCVGDVSGIGGRLERAELALAWRVPGPLMYVPGNHDSDATVRALRAKGANVLEYPGPRPLGVALPDGRTIRAWGYRDPNRSPLRGPPYDQPLTAEAGRRTLPPRDAGPYLVAVHNEAQVAVTPPEVRLVLAGHAHVPRVRKRGPVVHARCGTSGGGGVGYHGDRQFLLVDLELPSHEPRQVWLVETDGKATTVEPALPAG